VLFTTKKSIEIEHPVNINVNGISGSSFTKLNISCDLNMFMVYGVDGLIAANVRVFAMCPAIEIKQPQLKVK
jgi:hypothetical protein